MDSQKYSYDNKNQQAAVTQNNQRSQIAAALPAIIILIIIAIIIFFLVKKISQVIRNRFVTDVTEGIVNPTPTPSSIPSYFQETDNTDGENTFSFEDEDTEDKNISEILGKGKITPTPTSSKSKTTTTTKGGSAVAGTTTTGTYKTYSYPVTVYVTRTQVQESEEKHELTAELVKPYDDVEFNLGEDVTIKVDVEDEDDVEVVKFYLDDKKIGYAKDDPFEITFNTNDYFKGITTEKKAKIYAKVVGEHDIEIIPGKIEITVKP